MREFADKKANALTEGRACGLAAGTKVATSIGWRPVEALIAGDKVLTFDAGLQKITRIDRALLWAEDTPCPRHLWPMEVPAHALGNHAPMRLLPEQCVILESDTAEEIFGSPFSMVPAAALEGFRGIARTEPRGMVEVVSICFAEDQVVFANVGALFHCPRVIAGEIVRDSLEIEDGGLYAPMDIERAETLTAMIEAEESREAAY
ncbi:hypothetical protein PARPLA_01159 [Rhodobacteraceae bacterium THAF1]|uniref:Hint domain-containing protein n=1 Tax=Palleronia sp. THAF1 TaxID=2587842 RepID=UPI000F3F964B|nr:Hint domain-containing protein [Palleronia sp. THAF1]QFU07318.1 hypothetical protein FIU81_01385 [Palleronia sp. THAF1]VDC20770.1 hypothetical protein PARPLA_01159 [Rhodobacteraceae bacterium THAF1]